MADDYKLRNNLPAAAAAASSLPLPAMHDDVVKQINPLPVAVLLAMLPPADDDDEKTPLPNRILLTGTVCMWALIHALAFTIAMTHGDVWCIVAAEALGMVLFKLLTAAKSRILRGRWSAAVVDALAWMYVATKAGLHSMHVATNSYSFVDVVLVSGCLSADIVLAASFLLCCRQ